MSFLVKKKKKKREILLSLAQLTVVMVEMRSIHINSIYSLSKEDKTWGDLWSSTDVIALVWVWVAAKPFYTDAQETE